MEYWKQELYHHGILGMKWGKRNGPPYPLSPSQHSKSEQKAGWRKSLGGGKTAQRKPRETSENTKISTKARQIADKVTRYEKFKKEREKHWSNETRPLELAITAIKTHYSNKAIYYGTAFVGGVLAYKIADLTGHQEVIDIGKKVAFGIMATGVAYNTIGTAYNIARINYDATHKSGSVSNGSLNNKDYNKLEKSAIKNEYKKKKKNGETIPFKRYRNSTGENYNNVEKEYENKVRDIEKDSEYRKLSRAAFDAEKKRLLSTKKYINDDDKYEKWINSEEYLKLDKASEDATRRKEEYADKKVTQIKSEYEDRFKNAKLDDLKIFDKDQRDSAMKWIDSNISNPLVWDGNLDYNPDNFYEDWVDKEKFE